MINAKPNINAAEIKEVGILLSLICSHSLICVHWKNINTGDQIRIGEICYEGQSIGIVWKLLS
jgi:hypothetical protein